MVSGFNHISISMIDIDGGFSKDDPYICDEETTETLIGFLNNDKPLCFKLIMKNTAVGVDVVSTYICNKMSVRLAGQDKFYYFGGLTGDINNYMCIEIANCKATIFGAMGI